MLTVIEPLLLYVKSLGFYHKSYEKDGKFYLEMGTKLYSMSPPKSVPLISGTYNMIPEVTFILDKENFTRSAKRTNIPDNVINLVESKIKECYSFRDDHFVTEWQDR